MKHIILRKAAAVNGSNVATQLRTQEDFLLYPFIQWLHMFLSICSMLRTMLTQVEITKTQKNIKQKLERVHSSKILEHSLAIWQPPGSSSSRATQQVTMKRCFLPQRCQI